ncbi:hypothetical protein GU926_05120 [Nibribacter ruber]|uniref:Uncharacterized protein n=1 Tax=Nibribacter ruber TaxID=2698458 RepID=A0A6P1NYJ7_9BACT|nr:hypothetical protein [Nibribacter ruber]QHL86851.1 hypothetical protein GU926_05120 [Nibribacter ruber]
MEELLLNEIRKRVPKKRWKWVLGLGCLLFLLVNGKSVIETIIYCYSFIHPATKVSATLEVTPYVVPESVNLVGMYSDLNYGLLDIENTGKNEVKDININLKYNGYYQYEDTDGKTIQGKSSKLIVLSPLRAGNNFKVHLWVPYLDVTGINITHTQDKIEVEEVKKVTGYASIMSDIDLRPIFLTILILGIYWRVEWWVNKKKY